VSSPSVAVQNSQRESRQVAERQAERKEAEAAMVYPKSSVAE